MTAIQLQVRPQYLRPTRGDGYWGFAWRERGDKTIRVARLDRALTRFCANAMDLPDLEERALWTAVIGQAWLDYLGTYDRGARSFLRGDNGYARRILGLLGLDREYMRSLVEFVELLPDDPRGTALHRARPMIVTGDFVDLLKECGDDD